MSDHGEVDTGWFQEMAALSGDMVMLLQVTPERRLEFVSGDLAQRLGVTVGAEQALYEVSPQDIEAFEALIATAPGDVHEGQLRWNDQFGETVWTQVRARSRQRDDGSVVIEGVFHDISELKSAQSALATSERRHRLLVENAWDVIWTMGLDGSITYVSPAIQRVRGLTPSEAMVQTLDQIHPPEDAAHVGEYFTALFTAIATGAELPTFHGEKAYYRKDGSIMYGELQVIPHVDEEGNVVEILGVTRDISDRRLYEQELRRMAVTDPLTGVWNRRHGEALLTAAMAEARRTGRQLSVLMLDIDHFKNINDTLGHEAGDRVLSQITALIETFLRDDDVLCRWGGEEFVLVLRDLDLASAFVVAETLRGKVEESLFTGAAVTVSLGLASLDAHDTLAGLLDRADQALYDAKGAGRNTVASRGEPFAR